MYHLHSDLSNSLTPDSTSRYQAYIDLAVKNNMKALGFSEHGGVFEWIGKKQACDRAGIKYIHGMEAYLTESIEERLNQSYHIGLYARNWSGVKEINALSSASFVREDNHFYYRPRISLNELFNTSDNIIVTTACLGSILWQQRNNELLIKKILTWASENKDRVFLEIQYHNHPEQIEYNKTLYKWSKEYGIRLIAGTDTHSATPYDAECRKILQKAKKMSYGDEDTFDLTFKTYDELVEMFKQQNALPEEVFMEAIHNTNVLADMVEGFELDRSFKYPDLYSDEEEFYKNLVNKKYKEKVEKGIIDDRNKEYIRRIREETKVFKKLKMFSYLNFLSELVTWCWENGIPTGINRGSVGGSVVAYILDITDLDPVKWNTVFSRFCNEDRISLADVDIDFAPEDRERVYEYIINRFPESQTAYIITYNTISDKGTIDEIGRALDIPLNEVKIIKEEYSIDSERTREKYPEVFYYFDGLRGTIISKGMHPAGIVASPITLHDNIGFVIDNGVPIVQCNMSSVDSLNYVKFDILGLKNISIIKRAYQYAGIKYKRSHEIDWNDENVWKDMITSPVGIFQFEGDYAFSLLKKFKPKQINDMSLVTAALRPSGASYRDKLINREFHKNPSKEIDELLKDNLGYLIYQEDTIKFLMDICGFSGSEADTVRRAIGKKDEEELKKELPKILEGYCKMSQKPRSVAEEEAKEFIQIIQDSSDYQFGYNHATGYSMIGFICAMLRYYYPLEFLTAFLNCAANEDDIRNGTELANQLGIEIRPVKFRKSNADYTLSKEEGAIYKGIKSIKYMNEKIANELYELGKGQYDNFVSLLVDIVEKTSVNTRQLEILIKLNFFSEFGRSMELLNIYDEFLNGQNKYKKTYVESTKRKRINGLLKYEKLIKENGDKNKDIPIAEQVVFQKEIMGYSEIVITNLKNPQFVVLEIKKTNSPRVTLYNLKSGKEGVVKISRSNYFKGEGELFNIGDTLTNVEFMMRNKSRPDPNNPGRWIKLEEKEPWIISCSIRSK